MKKILVAFDVDGTLRDNTANQSVAPVANERVRTLLILMAHMKNVRIMVWSGGGELYARQVTAALGLQKYVDTYADKKYIGIAGCLGGNSTGADCVEVGHHHFGYDGPQPDIAIDDMQEFSLGKINLIVREK
jgi:phosphoserine phosphatase